MTMTLRAAAVPAPLIGVDIDGVLGDQISPAAPLVLDEFGIVLREQDVTTFSHPLADGKHIGHVLAKAMTDESFVRGMPARRGAAQMLSELRQIGRVKILTVRPLVADLWTQEWLAANQLSFDEFMLSGERQKSAGGTDVLIDDYPGNLREFMQATGGIGILVSRPWNHDPADRQELASLGRFAVAEQLTDVPAQLRQLLGA